jgi:hypothetical protein
VAPELFTHATYNAVVDGKRHKFISDRRQWDYDADAGMLRRTTGSLAMRIRLDAPITGAAHTQSTWAIRVADIAQSMPNQAEAMTKLSALVPDSAVNAPFPGTRSDKLQLLNGWLSPGRRSSRQAYRRARWYLRRRHSQTRISFQARSELGGPFIVLLNGEAVAAVSLPPSEWTPLSFDLSRAPFDETFVVELRFEHEPQKFSDGLFAVRRRRIWEPAANRLRRVARVMLPRAAILGRSG